MTDDLVLKMNETLPLRDVVFQTLKDAILRGILHPGDRLMEVAIAERLGVSRTPVREALRMLEKEGLVLNTPKRGAAVSGMSVKDMEDVLEIREALEELAVRLACDRISDEGRVQLKQKKTEFEESLKKGEINRIAKCDESFHDVIFSETGNPKLVAMLENLRNQIYRYRLEYLKDEANYPALLEEHEAICNGIMQNEKQDVATVMRKHINNQVDAVKIIIEKTNADEK